MEPIFSDNVIEQVFTDAQMGSTDPILGIYGNSIEPNSEEIHKRVRRNVTLVCIVCNLVSGVISLVLLYEIAKAKGRSKSIAEKRKLPLFDHSIHFVVCFFAMICCLCIVPFASVTQGYVDLILQGLILS